MSVSARDITAPAVYPLPEGYSTADEYENLLLTIALLEQAEGNADNVTEDDKKKLHQPFQGVKTMFADLDGYVSKIGRKIGKVSRVVSLKSTKTASIRSSSTRASATITPSNLKKKKFGFGSRFSSTRDEDATPMATTKSSIFSRQSSIFSRQSSIFSRLTRTSSKATTRLAHSILPCTSTAAAAESTRAECSTAAGSTTTPTMEKSTRATTTTTTESTRAREISGLPWTISATETTAEVHCVTSYEAFGSAGGNPAVVPEAAVVPDATASATSPPRSPRRVDSNDLRRVDSNDLRRVDSNDLRRVDSNDLRRVDSNDSDAIMEKLIATQRREEEGRKKSSVLELFGVSADVGGSADGSGLEVAATGYNDEELMGYNDEEVMGYERDDDEEEGELSGLDLDNLDELARDIDMESYLDSDDEAEGYGDGNAYSRGYDDERAYAEVYDDENSYAQGYDDERSYAQDHDVEDPDTPHIEYHDVFAHSTNHSHSHSVPMHTPPGPVQGLSPLLPRPAGSSPRRVLRIKPKALMRARQGSFRIQTNMNMSLSDDLDEPIPGVDDWSPAMYRDEITQPFYACTRATTATMDASSTTFYLPVQPNLDAQGTKRRAMKRRKASASADGRASWGRERENLKARGAYVFVGSLERLSEGGEEDYVVLEGGKRKRG